MKPSKVLSIGYVGHRAGSRLTRDSGKIAADLDAALKAIQSASQSIFSSQEANKLFADGDVSIRAIGGLADGADRLLIDALNTEDISLTIINSAFPEKNNQVISQKTGVDCSAIIHLDFEERFKAHEQIIQSRSDLLIAIWDGEKPKGRDGGTVRAIRNALHFGIPVIWIHASRDEKPTIIISNKKREPESSIEQALNCPCQCDDFNQLTAVLKKSLLPDADVQKSKTLRRYFKLITDKKDCSGELPDTPEYLQGRMNCADAVAGKMASRYRASVVGLYLLSAFAVFWAAVGYVFEEAFQHFAAEHVGSLPIAGISEILVIAMIIIWHWWGNKQGWHTAWIHSRFLAEILRMHQWLLPVMGIASFMYRQESTRTNWGHWLYRRYVISAPLSAIRIDQDIVEKNRKDIGEYLQDQLHYHKRKVSSEEFKHKLLHRGGYTLFALTLVAAVAHILHIGGHHMAPWFTMATIVFPAFGAAFHTIMVQTEVERLIATSEHMQKKLEGMKSLLDDAEKVAFLRDLSVDAAELMAGEASEWHQMVAFKKLELPA